MSIALPGRRGEAPQARAARALRAMLGVGLLLAASLLGRAAVWLRRELPAIAAGLAAAIPVLRSTVHAVSIGWQPAGDDGIIVTRGWDVFTAHSPLVGQYSEAGTVTGQIVHSPGPLLYWLLALPARFGSVAGIAGWMGAWNTVAIIGCVALARRRGGLALMFATAAAIALMCQSLPSESFHDVWNPAASLFPFMLLIFLCWSLACGDYRLAPLLVLDASFVTQTHLSYVTPTLGMIAVVAVCLLAARRRRGPPSGEVAAPGGEPAPTAAPPERGAAPLARARGARVRGGDELARTRVRARPRSIRRWVLAAIAVGAVCWAAPVIDEVEHSPGNLTLVVRTTQDRGVTLGAGIGWNAVVRAVGVAPWWLYVPASEWERKSDVRVTPGAGAVVSAVAIIAALGLLAGIAIARRRRELAAAALIALVLCAALAVNVAETPTVPLLAATIGYTAWWGSILGMWAWLVLAWALWLLSTRLAVRSQALARFDARWRARSGRRRRTVVALASLASLGVVSAAGVAVAAAERPDSHAHQYGPIDAIVARLDKVLPAHATVRFSLGGQDISTQPMEPAIRFGLVRHGDLPLSTGALARLGTHYELLDKPYSWYVLIGNGSSRLRHMARVVTVSFTDGFGHNTFSAWVARVGPGGRLQRPAGVGPAAAYAFGSRIG